MISSLDIKQNSRYREKMDFSVNIDKHNGESKKHQIFSRCEALMISNFLKVIGALQSKVKNIYLAPFYISQTTLKLYVEGSNNSFMHTSSLKQNILSWLTKQIYQTHNQHLMQLTKKLFQVISSASFRPIPLFQSVESKLDS